MPSNELENTITSNFDITADEIESIKTDIKTVADEIFNNFGIEPSPEDTQKIQKRFLSMTLTTMEETDWPPDEDSILVANTPEEHFRQAAEEMANGEEAAYNNISVTAGSLRSEVDEESKIRKLLEAIVGKKHQQ
jgi:hypothetical protein